MLLVAFRAQRAEPISRLTTQFGVDRSVLNSVCSAPNQSMEAIMRWKSLSLPCGLGAASDEAAAEGLTVVGMKDDRKTIFRKQCCTAQIDMWKGGERT